MFAGGGHPEGLRVGASGQAKGSCPPLLAEMLFFAFLSTVLEGRPTWQGSVSLASGDRPRGPQRGVCCCVTGGAGAQRGGCLLSLTFILTHVPPALPPAPHSLAII